MKWKIKILNFVLYLLGLKTNETTLVKQVGRSFELVTYEIQYYTEKRGNSDELLIKFVNDEFSNSDFMKFLDLQGLKKYRIDRNRKYGESCILNINFLNVKK